MTLREYLTSKVFFIQVLIAIAIMAGIMFIYSYWLDFTTNHGEEIPVPDLSRLTEEQAEEKLDELDLDYVVLDTVDFRKNYPKYTIVEQDPAAGFKVKRDRKIYLKINAGGFANVRIPDLIEKTYRQAAPTLKALGLEVGQITYEPYLGKDMVLEMKLNGKTLKPGDRVMKSSKIDLVLGDGKVSFEEQEQAQDTIVQDTLP